MGEVYVVTSGKGGVGKTTSTVNLALALTAMNKRVCIIDGDIGLRNMDVLLGLENRVINNIVDIVEGRCQPKEAMISYDNSESLYFIASSQTADYSRISPEQMKTLIGNIKDDFDYIIIDCPAGIEQGFKNAIAGAEKAIIVTMPVNSAIRDADRIKSLLIKNGINDLRILINRSREELVNRGHMVAPDTISDIMGLEILGIIPDDEAVLISANNGKPVALFNCPSGNAYRNAAFKLTGQMPKTETKEAKKGLFKRLFN